MALIDTDNIGAAVSADLVELVSLLQNSLNAVQGLVESRYEQERQLILANLPLLVRDGYVAPYPDADNKIVWLLRDDHLEQCLAAQAIAVADAHSEYRQALGNVRDYQASYKRTLKIGGYVEVARYSASDVWYGHPNYVRYIKDAISSAESYGGMNHIDELALDMTLPWWALLCISDF